MNNKLLLGAAAAGLAALFIKKRRDAKRNSVANAGYAAGQSTFKKDRHRTDIFSQAKNPGTGTWDAAPEPAK